MLTTTTEKIATLGWKYPSSSPFNGRMVVRNAPVELALELEEREPIKVKMPRHLAWLMGGDERVGFRILGRRVDPTSAPERQPHVGVKALDASH
ncbi:MAG TPA: hypothetical protein VF815_11175 [Myxococcaceae bacterium]|jgi:hypothetical protein